LKKSIFTSKALFISKSALSLFLFGLVRLIFKFSASVFIARILGPNQYGFWSIIELIHKYSPVVTLGVPSGVKYEIPYWHGKNKPLKARDLENTGLFWMVGYTILLSSVGIVYYFVSANDNLIRFAILTTMIGTGLFQLYQYLNVILLAHKKFYKSSLMYAFEGLVVLLLSIGLVYSYDLYGQLLVLPFASVIMIIFYYLFYRSKLKVEWVGGIILRTMKIGLLMIFVGIAYMFLLTANRLIISSYLGLEAVGYFSFAMLIITLFSNLTGSLGEVIYPYMNEHIGRYGRVDNMSKLVFMPALAKLLVIPILTGVALIITPYFIKYLMPQYVASVQVCQIMLISLTLTSGSINILGSYLKQYLLLIFLTCAITINISLSLIFLSYGYGINGVGFSLLSSLFTYNLLITLSSLYYMKVSIPTVIKYLVLSLGYPITSILLVTPLAMNYGPIYFQTISFVTMLMIPFIIITIIVKNPSIVEIS
jgi:O-antigen/teichoic acid export membrane protein